MGDKISFGDYLEDRTRSDSALASILIGDSMAIGYGSRSADVVAWPSEDTSFPRVGLWNKWTDGVRGTAADDGTALTPVDRTQGQASTDIGPEWGVANRYARALESAREREGGTAPQVGIAKFGLAGATTGFIPGGALSFSPLASGGAFEIFRDGYLDPMVTHLKANFAEVHFDRVMILIGQADAGGTVAGTAEAFTSSLSNLVSRLANHLGLTSLPGVSLVMPPLIDRIAYPAIDLIRESHTIVADGLLRAKVIDPDSLERGGYGLGTARLLNEFSGQGIVSLGNALGGFATDRTRILEKL